MLTLARELSLPRPWSGSYGAHLVDWPVADKQHVHGSRGDPTFFSCLLSLLGKCPYDIAMSKKSLREEAIRFRNTLDPFSEDVEQVVAEFFECLHPYAGQVVALYWPKGKEFDTGPLIEQLLKREIICVLPVIQKGSRELKFARFDESIPLEKGLYDILQPAITETTEWLDPDIVIAPMLAFDRQGHRLGYGGDYYDTTLAALRARKPVQAVGIGYSAQAVLFNLPSEPHDQKMDWIITPHKVQRLTL